MKKQACACAWFAFAYLSLFAFGIVPAQATVPYTINYQGFLTNPSTGAPLNAPSGSPLSITFNLYTSSAGGTPIYSETQSVVVTEGVFNVQIGSVTSLSSVPFNVPYWLGITIGTGASAQSLTPLQPLASAPTAIHAAVAEALLPVAGSGVENTADGSGALASNTTGNQNTAVGYNSLNANTTGYGNVAVGSLSLSTNTTGVGDTAVGASALQSNTTGTENTALGYYALQANTTGTSNTALGYYAMEVNSTGGGNTAVGTQALNGNTTGNFNTAIGDGALAANTTGSDNTSTGENTLINNSTGSRNTADGRVSLQQNTIGSDNVAIGWYALWENTTANKNTAVGSQALYWQSYADSNTAWDALNTAVGYEALYNNSPTGTGNGFTNTAVGAYSLAANGTGYANTAVGENALLSNTSATNNSAFGQDALHYSTTGGNDTALGQSALYNNSTGSNNTGVGMNALFYNNVGSNNTGVGYQAMFYINGGGTSNTSNNVAIGYQAGYAAGAGLNGSGNNIDIGAGVQGTSSDNGVTRIGLQGTTTATYVSGIYGTTVSGGSAVYVTSSGQLGVAASSERYKSEISTMGEASDRLFELRPVTFLLNNDPTRTVQYGLIAEEVDKVYPELVIRNPKGVVEGLHYEELAPMLLNEVQRQRSELRAERERSLALAARLDERDRDLAELRRTVTELMASLHAPALALAR